MMKRYENQWFHLLFLTNYLYHEGKGKIWREMQEKAAKQVRKTLKTIKSWRTLILVRLHHLYVQQRVIQKICRLSNEQLLIALSFCENACQKALTIFLTTKDLIYTKIYFAYKITSIEYVQFTSFFVSGGTKILSLASVCLKLTHANTEKKLFLQYYSNINTKLKH